MIEIPECITLSKQFAETFMGKTISHIYAGYTPHGFGWYDPEPEEYPILLSGKTLSAMDSFSGQVGLVFEDIHLVLNEGTTPHYLSADDPDPKKHQLLVRFSDGSGFYCTVRMYGGMVVYPRGETDNKYYLNARDKVSPLSEAFDRAYFQTIIDEAEEKLSAKALLATEQRIPGLGNGVLQDILFNAKVHPQRKLATMDDDTFDILFHSIKETLEKMTKQGGRDVEKDLFGNPGSYQTILSSKTKDTPCPQCGTIIERKAFLGGNIYYCSHCQPLIK